jgi:hypothetical protein
MTYTPTPTQSKQDTAIVAFIEALNQNLCFAEQASSCAIRGGARTKGRTRGRATNRGSDSDDSTTSNADRKTKKTTKKATPIKVKAARECEEEEEWEQYMNISRVFIITGTVGAGAMAMLGVFSGYANGVMETLGYGNIERTCAASNYLANSYAATLVPGMKTCAQVTQQQETMLKGVWGAIVALAAAFKISVPTSISETPGAAIVGFAKVLCRYFKERELHNELLQNIAKNTKGISQDDVNRAVAEALAAHQAQVLAGAQSASRSPSVTPQDISVGKNAQRVDATARSRRKTGIQSAPAVRTKGNRKSRTPTPTSPEYPHSLPSTPGSDLEEGERVKRVRRKRATREELHIRRKRRAQRNHLQRSVLLDVAKEESQVVKRLKSRSAKPKLNPKRNLADIRRAANKRNKLNV